MSRLRGLRGLRGMMAAGVLVALFVVAAILLGPPPRREDTGPGGIAALKRLLAARGLPVRTGAEPDGSETFFLPIDLRGPGEARRLVEWVRGGGILVVADPGSEVMRHVGVSTADGRVGGLLGARRLDTDCATPAVVGVAGVVARPEDARFAPGPAPALGCFTEGDGSFLMEIPIGRGRVVALGGLTPFTNEYLREEDDVVLAWNLLGAPGRPVAVGTPLPPGGGPAPGLWSLLPPPAKAIVIQLGLALVVLALARGRRLGPPVEEPVPSPIPATALVEASGELYRKSRDAGYGVTLLQRRFRTRIGMRLGLGPAPPDDELAETVRMTAGVPPEEILGALRPPGAPDERALLAAARRLETLERRIEGGAT